MSALTFTLVQLAYLALLWMFVLAAIGVLRRDLLTRGRAAKTSKKARLAAEKAAANQAALAGVGVGAGTGIDNGVAGVAGMAPVGAQAVGGYNGVEYVEPGLNATGYAGSGYSGAGYSGSMGAAPGDYPAGAYGSPGYAHDGYAPPGYQQAQVNPVHVVGAGAGYGHSASGSATVGGAPMSVAGSGVNQVVGSGVAASAPPITVVGPGSPARHSAGGNVAPVPTGLAITAGSLTGTWLPLSANPITIGRAPGNTLVLDDGYASGHHARVFEQNGQWYLEDLNSTNGTLLAGQPVQGVVPLTLGVPIRIGGTEIELVS